MPKLKKLFFDSFNDFSDFMDNVREREVDDTNVGYAVRYPAYRTNDGEIIVGRTIFDMETECKKAETAAKRLAKLFGISWMLEFINSDDFAYQCRGTFIHGECDDFFVESLGENRWYVACRQYDSI